MRAAVTTSEGGLALADVTPAPLQIGQVRVAVTYCGICGSDLHWRTHFPTGTVMGHEVTGRITEMALDVEGWAIGERVNIMPAESCGECRACRRGHPNICTQRRFGIGGPRGRGGYAESLVVLASMLVRIPDTVSDRAAALVEPLAVGLHAVSLAAADRDSPVALMGAGTIGMMTLLALRVKGFKSVVGIEPNPARRALVERLGFKAVDSSIGNSAVIEALGEQPAVIFECAGYAGALGTAVSLVAARGRIVLLSAPSEPVSLPQWELISKEAQIVTAMFYLREEFEDAVRLLDSGRVPEGAVPVTVFPLEQAPVALRELLRAGSPLMKVLLRP